MPADNTDRKRLGDLLVRRRVELDRRFRNRRVFASERDIGYHVVYVIESGRQIRFEPATIAVVESAYDLAPGAIERALDGGGLEPAPSPSLNGNGPQEPADQAAEHLRRTPGASDAEIAAYLEILRAFTPARDAQQRRQRRQRR